MAAGGNSSVKFHRIIPQSFSTALAAAVLEWLLIVMLFIHAIFSFLITKFASLCGLQTPCLICSRLDHVLGEKKVNKKLKYYWELICSNHKLEISSLVFCHAHDNLVDVHGMCETCLFSFATVNKSNAETYRLLVGKLGDDSSFSLDQDSLAEGHISSTRNCSCCNEAWIPKGCSESLIQTKSVDSDAINLDIHLSDSLGHHLGNPRKIKKFFSVGKTTERNIRADPLSHVVYTELNDNSDTEPEVPFSDDDLAHTLVHDFSLKEVVADGSILSEPRINIEADDLFTEKLLDPVSASKPSVSVSQTQFDVIESQSSVSVESKVPIEDGLEELNWKQADCKAHSSILHELISHDEVPTSSIAVEIPLEASKESIVISVNEVPPSSIAREFPIEASTEINLVSPHDVSQSPVDTETIVELSFESKPVETHVQESEESEFVPLGNTPSSSDTSQTPVEKSKENDLIDLVDGVISSDTKEIPVQGLEESHAAKSEKILKTSVPECGQSCMAVSRASMTEAASETIPVSGDNGPQAPNSLDLGDAYRLAVGSRGRQLSGVLLEQWIGKDSSRLSEDLKLLLSQLSFNREQSLNDMSPRIPISPKLSASTDEMKSYDASSVIGMQILQKRISLERNESGLSLDGCLVSEIEGESLVDRLKRQVEHDKKLLGALYKELEEERNASAISANQAMAMITRLQEEKAALHMEALQNLRMMEEQSEYDMEALQKTSDLLEEKEKKIQDLEAELEFYRNKSPHEPIPLDTSETFSDIKEADIRVDHSEDKKTGTDNNLLFQFEDERTYILRSLKKLENKLYLFSNNWVDLDGDEYLETERETINEQKKLNNKAHSQQNNSIDENAAARGHDASLEKPELPAAENTESTNVHVGIDLDALVHEVSDLNKRLEALEVDRNFLEQSINSIRNGKEGVLFIQDIASQLKELRKLGLRKVEQSAG